MLFQSKRLPSISQRSGIQSAPFFGTSHCVACHCLVHRSTGHGSQQDTVKIGETGHLIVTVDTPGTSGTSDFVVLQCFTRCRSFWARVPKANVPKPASQPRFCNPKRVAQGPVGDFETTKTPQMLPSLHGGCSEAPRFPQVVGSTSIRAWCRTTERWSSAAAAANLMARNPKQRMRPEAMEFGRLLGLN